MRRYGKQSGQLFPQKEMSDNTYYMKIIYISNLSVYHCQQTCVTEIQVQFALYLIRGALNW